MQTESRLSSWQVEEELTVEGERHIYIRVPGAAKVSNDLSVLIQREMEPPFLSAEGWGFEARPFAPEHISRDGQDLLIQLSDDYTDHINDFDPINLQIEGTDFQGVFPWVFEPHHKLYADQFTGEPGGETSPQVSFRASQSQIQVGQTVELIWQSDYADTLQASGDWQGVKALTGKDVVILSDAGKKEFILDAVGKGGASVASVVVHVSAEPTRPPWLIPLIVGIVILLLIVLFWFWPSSQGSEPEPEPEPEPNPPWTDPVEPPEPTPVPDPYGNGGNGGASSTTIQDPFEQLKVLIANGQYNKAREKLDELTKADSHPGAALIAAENLGNPNFTPGLFDERNDDVTLKYYRLACEGGVGARSSLEAWQQGLMAENQQLHSAALKSMIEDKIPAAFQNCKN